MTQYLISFGAHAMDHIPDQDAPAIGGLTIVDVPSREDALRWAAEHRRRLPLRARGPGDRGRSRTRRDAPPG